MIPIKTILHPTDFSKPSEYALRFACALARDYQARLIVLHVATPPPFITPGELQAALERPGGYKAELERRLRQVYQTDAPGSAEYRVVDGEPAVEIDAAARKGSCDLIVMGTHGRTGLQRLLAGSVAEKVSRSAPCPVVTVKVPAHYTRST